MVAEMTTTSRRKAVLDLPLRLERGAGSQARRIHAAIRDAILDGQLAAGLRLPSSRALAEQLGVRRSVVVVAYEHLYGDGLVESRTGAGTYVAAGIQVHAPAPTAPVAITVPSRRACAVGSTTVSRNLLRRFGMAARRRIAQAGAADLFRGDPRGTRALREQIAAHLAASRGFRADPDCIIVVGSVQQGLRLCAEALFSPGDAVWTEDPGYPPTHRTLRAAGLQLIAIPVDAEGLDVTAGRKRSSDARAAYVTPSNQFPTSVSMPMPRRLALLEWAREARAWVLEDDYDNEFRYDGPPLTALAGLDGGDRVIYFGTFSKMLFSSVRLAYVVAPAAALERMIAARASYDRFPPSLLEGAVADLMADGTLAAHTRHVRKHYRMARDTLASALEQSAGTHLRIVKPAQGLHLLAYLAGDVSPEAASQILEQAGVESWLLSETRLEVHGPEGFILGFAGHTEADLRHAAVALGAAVRSVLG
ncbi:PLP-dependent aminotransferase family protein [Methylobacterium nodulans]|uniref:8-amino-7-oxononanoate synthase n=1 Tax=Methylobacterium nodulans (strain LMG 21967 / CNCM I-2342 / ORS 2060) TaxID=460265 RepID=B8IGC1_METNO|nr:PLP-dependent aminotransferase family protein [Methylobacterium nodulans]ACL61598.1 transcriptional regulator, GntR family with aminotransferase domain protein [Methylobacterium nodulans ORS 2060]